MVNLFDVLRHVVSATTKSPASNVLPACAVRRPRVATPESFRKPRLPNLAEPRRRRRLLSELFRCMVNFPGSSHQDLGALAEAAADGVGPGQPVM